MHFLVVKTCQDLSRLDADVETKASKALVLEHNSEHSVLTTGLEPATFWTLAKQLLALGHKHQAFSI